MEKFLARSVPLYLVLGIISFFLAFSFVGFAVNKSFKDGHLPPTWLVSLFDGFGSAPVELAKGVSQILSHRSLVDSLYDTAGFTVNDTVIDDTYGYLLLSRFGMEDDQALVDLVDLGTKQTLHTWSYNAEQLWSELDEYPNQAELQRDKNGQGMRMVHPVALADGGLIFQDSSPLIKVDACSALDWVNADYEFHHSAEQDADGNLWVPSRIFDSETRMVQFQGNGDYFRDEGIALVAPSGETLFQKNLIEIFEENDLGVYLYGMGLGHLGSRHNDPLHINDIEPVLEDGAFWRKGDVFMSFRHRSMIMQYRPSTNEVIWQQIGPWLHQHDVDIISPTQISIFNNNAVDPSDKRGTFNDVMIYDFATDAVTRPYRDAFEANAIQTFYEGRSQIMDDGRVFVEESNLGRALVLDEAGNVEWSYINKPSAEAEQVGVLGWSRLVPTALGDQIRQAVAAVECTP